MIFIDTGAFLGRYLSRDQHHAKARAGWTELAGQSWRLYTSNFVLDETFTLLGRRADHAFAAERARRILASRALTILRPDARDEHEALGIFEKFSDQRLSFTDCISFTLMKRHRLQIAFSFDADFERAGFALWPGRSGGTSWVHEAADGA